MSFKLQTSNFLVCIGLAIVSFSTQATIILYNQDFENPAAFVNDGGDVNTHNSVNTLYGNQPSGFSFAQAFTVDTLLVTGNQAFGTGYSDPAGSAGNYTLGMLSNAQNDLLGLSFNVGSNDFLNTSLDISSIDLSVFGGPFVSPGDIPIFEFTLFDNPGGSTGLGSGAVLDSLQVSGTASARDVFDWTNILLPLDARGNTNGNVTLRIDLLSGGYAAMDNFIIAASNTSGDIGGGDNPITVPEPTSLALLALGIAGIGFSNKKKRAAPSK